MLAATLLSLGVVFVFFAELGDRSQLITFTYALWYRWWLVVSAGVTVAVGWTLGAALPMRPLCFVAFAAFAAVAVWPRRNGAVEASSVAAPQTLRRRRSAASIAGRLPQIA